jgi:hypothetical protein
VQEVAQPRYTAEFSAGDLAGCYTATYGPNQIEPARLAHSSPCGLRFCIQITVTFKIIELPLTLVDKGAKFTSQSQHQYTLPPQKTIRTSKTFKKQGSANLNQHHKRSTALCRTHDVNVAFICTVALTYKQNRKCRAFWDSHHEHFTWYCLTGATKKSCKM